MKGNREVYNASFYSIKMCTLAAFDLSARKLLDRN
jgi:hypothetical protein